MAASKNNGKPVHPADLERELPPATAESDDLEASADNGTPASASQTLAAPVEDESQKLKRERDALLDRLARLQAEFENYRKRNVREQQEYREYALASALASFIPALDSFDLALKNLKTSDSAAIPGLELVRKQFADALAKLGVTPVPAQGKPFDPRWHQAVEVVESDEVADHHVLEELQPGYRLKDRVLRPAMVRVASAPKKK